MVNVGNSIQKERGLWDFNGKTLVNNFDEHVSRSVMLYNEGHNLVCYLSDFFCHKNSVCYDLGTSTGELLLKLAKYNKHKPGIQWIGIDAVQDMVDKATQKAAGLNNIKFVKDDIVTYKYRNADLICAYYTIQFISQNLRLKAIQKVYDSLNCGGAFILFEKIHEDSGLFQDIAVQTYMEYKLNNGFTSEEVLSKSLAIKGVLVSNTSSENIQLLKQAGFKKVIVIFKCICFEGILAIK